MDISSSNLKTKMAANYAKIDKVHFTTIAACPKFMIFKILLWNIN